MRVIPVSMFPDPEPERPPQAARLAPKLRTLADRGVYFGTSSWKYKEWLGSIYSPDRYLTRGKHSRAKFEAGCLGEYEFRFNNRDDHQLSILFDRIYKPRLIERRLP